MDRSTFWKPAPGRAAESSTNRLGRRPGLRRRALAVGAACIALAMAACDRPTPMEFEIPTARDINVPDPTGTLVVEYPTYLGEDARTVDQRLMLNRRDLRYSLIRIADGQAVYLRDLYSLPTVFEVSGQQPGDYRAEISYYNDDAREWQPIAQSAVVTLDESATVPVPVELGAGLGVVGGILRVNGEPPPDRRYRICPLVPPGRPNACSTFNDLVSNGTGEFRFWSVPGDGTFEVRTTTDVLLGTFEYSASAGQTSIVADLDVTDPTGTVVVEYPAYLGEDARAVDQRLMLNRRDLRYSLIRIADGQAVYLRDLYSLPTVFEVSGQQPGDYRAEISYYNDDAREWQPIAQSAVVTLDESGTVPVPVELGADLGVVGGVLRINGEPPPDRQYRICPLLAPGRPNACSTFNDLVSGGTGEFRFWSVPGDGIFEVRTTTTNLLVGTFEYSASAGQTSIVPNLDLTDGLGTLVVEYPTYLGEDARTVDQRLMLNRRDLRYSLIRIADGQAVYLRDLYSLPTLFEVSGQQPGDYRAEISYYNDDAREWQPIAQSAVVTLDESGTVPVPVELGADLGVVGGVLRVNGEPPPDRQYRLCPLVAPGRPNACGSFNDLISSGTGEFRFWSVPGDGIFEVRTTTNVLLGTFTYRAAEGQTTIVGDLTGGNPGETEVGADVTVQPVNTGQNTTNTSATLTFDNVSSAGTTTVATSPQGPPPTNGYKLGTPPIYYDLTTTAGFTGSVTVCINYTGTTFNNPEKLVLQHWDGSGAWQDITVSHDLVERIICGVTSSLSPFIVMEAPDNLPPTADPGQNDPTGYVGVEGTPVQFDGSSSSDPDGDLLDFDWTFGDGAVGTGPTPTHAFADNGDFQVTLSVSDGNGGTDAVDVDVTIANAPPEITTVTIPTAPVSVGTAATVAATYTDPGLADTHTGSVRWGTEAAFLPADVQGGAGSGSVSATRSDLPAGVYRISFEVEDDDLGTAGATATDYLVVYDPSGGFVTGGGWIDSPPGACAWSGCAIDGTTTGKASFGFVSRYKRGATVPDGNTEFEFKAGNLTFESTAYEWLVVAGSRAQFKGSGQINGQGDYGFLLTAIDEGSGNGSGDAFRIKIVDRATDTVVYDNRLGEDDDGNAATPIGGGSIMIHTQGGNGR